MKKLVIAILFACVVIGCPNPTEKEIFTTVDNNTISTVDNGRTYTLETTHSITKSIVSGATGTFTVSNSSGPLAKFESGIIEKTETGYKLTKGENTLEIKVNNYGAIIGITGIVPKVGEREDLEFTGNGFTLKSTQNPDPTPPSGEDTNTGEDNTNNGSDDNSGDSSGDGPEEDPDEDE